MYGVSAVVLNEKEILLVGGFSMENCMNEMHVLDYQELTCRKVATQNTHPIWTAFFPSVAAGPNKVYTVDYCSRQVFEYRHIGETVTVIAELPKELPASDSDSY